MKIVTKGMLYSVHDLDQPQYYIEIYEQRLRFYLAAKIYHRAHSFAEWVLDRTHLMGPLNRWWDRDNGFTTALTKRDMPLDCYWDCVCYTKSRKNYETVERWENVSKEAYDKVRRGFSYSGF